MKTKKIKVICFYWQGERWQEDGMNYDSLDLTDQAYIKHLKRSSPIDRKTVEHYINNLYKGVEKWSVHPFDFICFSNDDLKLDKEIELKPFELVTTRGVLPRMWMFSEAAGLFGHQVLSLDIDVIITGSLKDIMNYNGNYCTRVSWQKASMGKLDGDIMSFKAGTETEAMFWTPLIENIKKAEKFTQGRERMWIRKVTEGIADTWSKIAPNQVVGYKRHVRKYGTLPDQARIVSCHGHPRPHEIDQQWRINNWKNEKRFN